MENIKYTLTVEDEDTGEVIYHDWAYSMESLEEKTYKIERSVKKHLEEKNKPNEDEIDGSSEQDQAVCELCHGTGVVVGGEHDDLWEKKCLCQKQDDMDDDS